MLLTRGDFKYFYRCWIEDMDGEELPLPQVDQHTRRTQSIVVTKFRKRIELINDSAFYHRLLHRLIPYTVTPPDLRKYSCLELYCLYSNTVPTSMIPIYNSQLLQMLSQR